MPVAERPQVFQDMFHVKHHPARALYEWFLPLLHLDIGSKFVQQIKLVEALVGVGSAKVRAPRMQLSEAEATRVEAILAEALERRPQLD